MGNVVIGVKGEVCSCYHSKMKCKESCVVAYYAITLSCITFGHQLTPCIIFDTHKPSILTLRVGWARMGLRVGGWRHASPTASTLATWGDSKGQDVVRPHSERETERDRLIGCSMDRVVTEAKKAVRRRKKVN